MAVNSSNNITIEQLNFWIYAIDTKLKKAFYQSEIKTKPTCYNSNGKKYYYDRSKYDKQYYNKYRKIPANDSYLLANRDEVLDLIKVITKFKTKYCYNLDVLCSKLRTEYDIKINRSLIDYWRRGDACPIRAKVEYIKSVILNADREIMRRGVNEQTRFF